MKRKRRNGRVRSTRNRLHTKARTGFRGYPIATIAYYGPDDQFASKVAVGIMLKKDDEDAAFLERWFSTGEDVRTDAAINEQIVDFVRRHKVKSTLIPDRIIGCPHEEGKDYPSGEACPHCPFWANRDRWTGELLEDQDRKPAMLTGCAWYREEQWERLREVAVDADRLGETYQDWLANAEQRLRELRQMGVYAEKVDVDVEELLAWCQAQGREVNGAARAAYAAEMVGRIGK